MSTTERKYKRVFESIIKKLNFGSRIRRKVGEWTHITGAQGVCNLGTFGKWGMYICMYICVSTLSIKWAHITGGQGIYICELLGVKDGDIFQHCCLYVYILPHVGRICEIQSE